MRDLICHIIGHDVDQVVRYWIGGIYPHRLAWCNGCWRWFDADRPIRRRPRWLAF